MKLTLFFLVIASLFSKAHATSQIPENLIINGSTNNLYSTPLDSQISRNNRKLKKYFMNAPCTACWRNYVGTWIIEDNKLYLVSVKQGYPSKDQIPLKHINRKWKSPVAATWFTGTIRMGKGKVLVRGMGLSTKREQDVFLEIKDGKVTSTHTVDHRKQPEKSPSLAEQLAQKKSSPISPEMKSSMGKSVQSQVNEEINKLPIWLKFCQQGKKILSPCFPACSTGAHPVHGKGELSFKPPAKGAHAG